MSEKAKQKKETQPRLLFSCPANCGENSEGRGTRLWPCPSFHASVAVKDAGAPQKGHCAQLLEKLTLAPPLFSVAASMASTTASAVSSSSGEWMCSA